MENRTCDWHCVDQLKCNLILMCSNPILIIPWIVCFDFAVRRLLGLCQAFIYNCENSWYFSSYSQLFPKFNLGIHLCATELSIRCNHSPRYSRRKLMLWKCSQRSWPYKPILPSSNTPMIVNLLRFRQMGSNMAYLSPLILRAAIK